MKRIRINGLVKLMNHCRKQLANGIPATEVQAFKKMVSDATKFVEATCREHHIPLRDLPVPTCRTYEYLKGIDLEHLPILGDDEKKPVSSLRISSVIASCKNIQSEFAQLVRAKEAGSMGDKRLEERLATLHRDIAQLAAMVDEIFQKVDAAPDLLPDPTRRAYQWLKFLSEHGNFQEHFQTLTIACHALPDAKIELYNFAGLYRSKLRKGVWYVVLSEGFVGAPSAVIKALLVAAVSREGRAQKERVQQYAETEEFREILLSMEMMGVQSKQKVRGAIYDLEEVFQRVNSRYFHGRMKKPILTWNKMITRAKYGHYVPATDTVMISIALDAKDVPAYVIDHVMHHELLHKKLGSKLTNGRRLAHTPEFRAEEKKFQHYQQAQVFLAELSRVKSNV